MNNDTKANAKFTQYISPWHDGYRTKTVIDRAERKMWMIFQENGEGRSYTSEPQLLTAANLAELESFLATTCERHDHN